MSLLAIKFQNISKQYRLGQIGTGTLSHDLNRWLHRIRGKEDPYSKIGETNIRNIKGFSDYVWALQNIDFEVKQGDVIGIIGKNGAGKSTLLKILSKVTKPTSGLIKVKGRIASLLEVGTGFHHEMTGRENIYMNGSIMGMTKSEITRKFDEIVDFAGVERYIDTPVKRFSSGMIVRLGFAVAAHLEPEIMVVDEVLAVGDAEFQNKAIGKMQNISKNEGRTVLFVSHNMGAIRNLCNSGVVLNNGSVDFIGEINTVVDFYLAGYKNSLSRRTVISNKHRLYQCSKDIELLEAELINETEIATNESILIKLKLGINNSSKRELRIKGMINNSSGNRVGCFFSNHFSVPNHKKNFEILITLYNHNLAKGQYSLDFNIGLGDPTSAITDYDVVYNVLAFEVLYDDYVNKELITKWPSSWGNIYYRHVDVKVVPQNSNDKHNLH